MLETAWLVKVNKIFGGSVPTRPDQRANIIDQYGENRSRKSTDDEITVYERWYKDHEVDLLQCILNEYPDPEGRVWQVSEFVKMESYG